MSDPPIGHASRHLQEGRTPLQEAAPVLVAVSAFPAVWWTVGPVAAGLVLAVLVLDWVILPGRQVLGSAAVLAMVLVPIAWFSGSGLPLYPAVPRAQANLLVHHLAGGATWLLFLTVLFDVSKRRGKDAV